MVSGMDKDRLTPANASDLEQGLAFALRFDGRKRVHTGDEFMARITARRIIAWLDRSGFVVLRKPLSKPHGPTMRDPVDDASLEEG
jgi:hypothetical protein